jgi:hypothetical protein
LGKKSAKNRRFDFKAAKNRQKIGDFDLKSAKIGKIAAILT